MHLHEYCVAAEVGRCKPLTCCHKAVAIAFHHEHLSMKRLDRRLGTRRLRKSSGFDSLLGIFLVKISRYEMELITARTLQ
jgi:hypothetical protein